jgi:hypothetical protein
MEASVLLFCTSPTLEDSLAGDIGYKIGLRGSCYMVKSSRFGYSIYFFMSWNAIIS